MTPASDVGAYLTAIEPAERRADCAALIEIMSRVTGEPPRLWGSMVGFGTYHYRYDSGHEGDSFLAGFAARKAAIVIYVPGRLLPAEAARAEALVGRLGKHTAGKGCLYVKRLRDVNAAVLEEVIALAAQALKEQYPA